MQSDSTQTPAQGHFATVNGFQMYYEVYGEGPHWSCFMDSQGLVWTGAPLKMDVTL